MQRVHFQVRLAKISFVIFDIGGKKQIKCGLAWYLTIILRNRAEYRLILSRRASAKIRRHSER